MKSIFKHTNVIILGILVFLGIMFSWVQVSSAAFRVVQTPTYHLYTGESGSATSMRITPYPVDLDGVKLTITDFGSTPTLTVDPKLSGIEEIESFTSIVDNGDNTATLYGLSRDLQSKYPYTGTGTGRAHGSGATVVFGNNPQVYGRLAAPENTQTWTAVQTYASTTMPQYDASPSNTQWAAANGASFVNLDKLNSTAIAGAPNATESLNGVVQLATQIQQASSTSLGGTGAYLALQSKYATSSPNGTVASLYTLILNNLGKIAQTAIDFTQLFTFTGGLTSTGTTTVSASSLTTNPFTINSLAYKFPSIRGAVNTVLTEDGAGTLTFSSPVIPRYTFATTTAITITGGYATSTALSIPASFVTASSSILITGTFTCAVGVSSSGDTCDLYLRDTTGTSATLVSHTLFATIDNGNTTFTGTFTARILMNNSVSSQKGQMLCSYIGYNAAFVSGKSTFCGDSGSTSQNWANAFSIAAVVKATSGATAGLSNLFIEVDR